MIRVSSGAVWGAALVLVGAASVGSYLGYSRAAALPGGSVDAETYVAPLAAKKATSVDAATAPPPVDENYIRKIAHDEAMAILHPAPRKVAVAQAADDSDDDSGDDDGGDKPVGANPPTPPPASPTPAAAAKPPPPPPTGLY